MKSKAAELAGFAALIAAYPIFIAAWLLIALASLPAYGRHAWTH